MNKNIGIAIGVLVLVGIGVYGSMNKKQDDVLSMQKSADVVMQDDGMQKDVMMNKETSVMPDQEMNKDGMQNTAIMTKGSYEVYAPEKIAYTETGDTVLFFHAGWCPSCRSLDANIEANKDTISEGVRILKVDYDKETELKKKYGVTTQHTLVQVDKEGNLIKKWSGSPKLMSLISEIQ